MERKSRYLVMAPLPVRDHRELVKASQDAFARHDQVLPLPRKTETWALRFCSAPRHDFAPPFTKRCFQQHLAETKIQKQRLEQVFRLMDMKVSSSVSDGIRGILDEGQVLMMCKGDPAVKDAAMIACAQRVEHYEMACYGSARSFAQYLGRSDVAALLQQTLDEEGETDKLLTSVAISGINQAAAVR